MFPTGGYSISDQTSVSFDPFNNQSRATANNVNVKSTVGLTLSNLVPILVVGVLGFLAYKLLFK